MRTQKTDLESLLRVMQAHRGFGCLLHEAKGSALGRSLFDVRDFMSAPSMKLSLTGQLSDSVLGREQFLREVDVLHPLELLHLSVIPA